MNNSFPTFPKRLNLNDPCDCDQLFQVGNNKIYIQSPDMIAPYCNEGVLIQDNRANENSCSYQASYDPPQDFDEFGVPLPLIFENIFLVYTSLNSWLGENNLPNGNVNQWIMDVNSDRPWSSPLVGESEPNGGILAPIKNPCNPSGHYTPFFGNSPRATVSLAPF
jgi:hypothetical protein